MNRKAGLINVTAKILVFFIFLSGCSTDNNEKFIKENLTTKLNSISSGDSDLYMTTVTQNDYYYRNEQLRWFTEMASKGIEDIEITVDDIKFSDNETAVVTIHQTHKNNEKFDFSYPALFKLENGIWVDCGYNFQSLDAGWFTIKYMEGETRVNDFIKMTNEAYDNLEPIFAERPNDRFEIKLFNDMELLRQRTIPSNAWLFTGWGEPNESLKLFTGHPEIYSYKGTVQHEVVHHITINICNNNLPVWLYEGVAMYYGSAYYGFENSAILSSLKKENLKTPVSALEVLNSSKLTETVDIYNWYGQNFMYTAYLIETYGHDKYMELWYEAGKKPFNDSAANPNFYSQNNETMGEVLMTVLNLTKQQLTEDYLNWLGTTDILENPPFG